jgi:hypothetical protein
MDKKTAGLASVISALTPLAAAAAPPAQSLAEVLAPQSYSELLRPIPNASALMREASAITPETRPESNIKTAQYYGNPYYYHHHHHHHHHSNYGGWGGWGWGQRPYYHHHHHHHHHNNYWFPY